MFQAALFETMKTAFAPWRTAVWISMALIPNAPSPLTEITCRSSSASSYTTGQGSSSGRRMDGVRLCLIIDENNFSLDGTRRTIWGLVIAVVDGAGPLLLS